MSHMYLHNSLMFTVFTGVYFAFITFHSRCRLTLTADDVGSCDTRANNVGQQCWPCVAGLTFSDPEYLPIF